MSIITIILILIGVIIVYFATKFLGKAFKIVTKIMLLLVVIMMVLTLLVYKDMNELRNGFAEQNNTFLLYDDNKIYTAITLKPLLSNNLNIESFSYFNKLDIEEAEKNLNEENYDAVLKNNYKILIIKPSVLNKSYKIKLSIEIDQDDLIELIKSDIPFKVLAYKVAEEHNVSVPELELGFKQAYGSQEKFKGYLFAALLSNYLQKQNPGDLVDNLKEKNIIVYPESISFKVVRYLPWV